ncbi:hypothetical protein SLS60_000375 [Paraconiothyrium brasiliense]|uniref:Heterokaryon incompatibility domain-containing protein n=1 Tax=Paraconiothyrium brasiliense TaxID=300254 RepID=A0ABR3S624_9PLEO
MGQSTIRLLDSDTHQIDKSTLFSGRAVDPSRANFNMARSWLQECDNEHDCLQRDGMKNILIKGLLVIDVERLCIVEVPYDARYVALSYVWPWFRDWKNFVPLQLNRSNLEEFKKPGYMSKMQSGLPNVIKDAFQAVRNLNETYIWIDALCIIQDDEVAKTQLVRRMDQIYGGAYLTIVAATSAEPTEDYSIPGVGITRKDQQIIETVDGLRFVNALPDYNDSLKTTRWVTRGWTFQEGLLSRRCLIFTEHQMYFRCTRDARCEDVNVSGQQTALCNAHPAKPNERLSKVDYLLNSDFLQRGRDADWFGEYIRIVSEFTKRNLTVESDVMSAFTGIMNRFSPYIEGTGFSAGLPFKRFEQSLLWLPTSASKGRTAPVQPPGHMYRFPSWSWAGWIGGVDYEIGRPGERPVIDQHLDLVQWFRWAGQSYGLVPVRDSWHLYNPPEAKGPRGYEFGRLVGHRPALEANTTLMISWVTSILRNLRLPEVHLVHWVTDWDQSLPCLIVEDQECLPCGFIVSADRTWAQRYKRKGGGLCELLLLSITGRSQDDLRNAELLLHAKYRPAGHRLPVYINVMLIEYGEDESDPANEKAVMSYDPQVSMEREHRIAYRRGIGLMHVESVNFQDLTSNDRKILILG